MATLRHEFVVDAAPALVAPAFTISAPPTAANHRIALGDDSASSTPRRKLRHGKGSGAALSASPSTGGADAGLSASRAIFHVSMSSSAEPPIHTTQRTAENCSSAAMPASASAA